MLNLVISVAGKAQGDAAKIAPILTVVEIPLCSFKKQMNPSLTEGANIANDLPGFLFIQNPFPGWHD